MSQTPAKQEQNQTMGNFLAIPNTQRFLEDNLKEKKAEFVSNLISLYEQDNNLQQCDKGDLMKCAMSATALNLPLNKNLGYAYIIPYKGVPSFQIGYKGLIQLAIRTGSYKHLNATEIREGEIERNKITGELKYKGEKPENDIVGYIAYLELTSGFSASVYMSVNEIEIHATQYSKVYQSDLRNKTKKSLWSNPTERTKMAKKTVLKKLLGTYGLMTTEMVSALDKDRDVEHISGNRSYEDAEIVPQNEPDQPEKIKI